MKLTEEQIWKCNQTINYKNGKVVDAVHICVAHQNVVDFARSIEREIEFAKATIMKRPIESDYTSLVAYTRALEEYCDALAQPEQEPVKIIHEHEWFKNGEMKVGQMRCISCGTWGQEEIPQRTWVGLTAEDKLTAVWTDGVFGAGALWAEKQLKELNHG